MLRTCVPWPHARCRPARLRHAAALPRFFTLLQGIDKVLFYHEWRHHLQAYVTEPPLCSHGPSGDGAGSTLEYDRGGSVAAVVGRLLRRARSLVAPLLGQESLEGNRHGHGGLWKRGSRKSDPGLDALRGSEARGA